MSLLGLKTQNNKNKTPTPKKSEAPQKGKSTDFIQSDSLGSAQTRLQEDCNWTLPALPRNL